MIVEKDARKKDNNENQNKAAKAGLVQVTDGIAIVRTFFCINVLNI